MGATKTNKSFSKRIKVTKTGKLKVRRAGQGHYNAKESGTKRQKKRRKKDLDISAKAIQRELPHH